MKKNKHRGPSALADNAASQPAGGKTDDPRPSADRQSPAPLYLGYVAWLLIALPVLLGLLYVYTYGVNIAWEDQFFSMTSTFEKYYGGNLHLSDFWQQHNEHRHF